MKGIVLSQAKRHVIGPKMPPRRAWHVKFIEKDELVRSLNNDVLRGNSDGFKERSDRRAVRLPDDDLIAGEAGDTHGWNARHIPNDCIPIAASINASAPHRGLTNKSNPLHSREQRCFQVGTHDLVRCIWLDDVTHVALFYRLLQHMALFGHHKQTPDTRSSPEPDQKT